LSAVGGSAEGPPTGRGLPLCWRCRSRPAGRGSPELMLTQGEDVEVQALRKRGWSYVAIGRHIDCDWRTVKAYLEGREPGVRRRSEPDPLERFAPYLRARFADDPHVWGSALFDEVTELGYTLSYPSSCARSATPGCAPTARPAPASSAGTRSTSPTRRAR